MKTQRNILIALILNAVFSLFELIGGIATGSTAILSDALHDLGDALSIGLSWILERKSKKSPDETFTYGYARYSVLGSLLTTGILLAGSVLVIRHAIVSLIYPVEIHYEGMILLACIGLVVNLAAAFFTHEGHSLNQKAVNLHMLEDVLGWLVVLVGAVFMRFTHISLLDPILSIAVSVFILVHAFKNLKQSLDVFLEKKPQELNLNDIRDQLCQLSGVVDVHHIHLWSLDGHLHCATMHLVATESPKKIKRSVRSLLQSFGIVHTVLELEVPGEHCSEQSCSITFEHSCQHHHH